MKAHYQIRRLATLFAALLVTVSCIREKVDIPRPANPSQVVDLQFTIRTPGNRNATRALESKDENNVEDLILLLFGPNKGPFELQAATEVVSRDNGTYRVKIPVGTWDIMLLANAAEDIRTSFPSGIAKGTAMNEVITQLQVAADRWDSNPGTADYRDIPMWDYKANRTIDHWTSFVGTDKFNMVRMLARVNVTLHEDAAEVFKLTSVSVYNRRTRGQVIPNLNDDGGASGSPSLVSGADVVKGPLRYDGSAIADDKECVNEIYLFEAPKGVTAAFPDYPCIVVGGTYQDVPGYYRIDMVRRSSDGSTALLDIMRNRTYEVLILGVNSTGYGDEEDAYTAPAVNIQAEVVEWDDGSMDGFVIGEDCFLSFTPKEMEFDMLAQTPESSHNDLRIYTDWKDGWRIVDISYEDPQNAGWISIADADKTSGPTGDKTIKVNVSANDAAGAVTRKGYIHIKAARLTYKLPVTQTNDADVWIRVVDENGDEISELIFYGYPNRPELVTDQKFTVEWGPVSVNMTPTTLLVGNELFNMNGFTQPLLSGSQYDGNGVGKEEFTVNPGAFTPAEVDPYSGNPFLEKGVRIEFSVTHGEKTARKNLYVRQLNFALITENVTQLSHLGHDYSFTVKSNAPWRIKAVIDPHNLLTSNDLVVGNTGGNNTILGERLNYKMVDPIPDPDNAQYNGLGQAGRWFEVVFEDQNGVFQDDTVKIIAISPDMNCVMRPYVSGGPVHFPIRKAFWMWESDYLVDAKNEAGMDFDYDHFDWNDLSARVLWQDETLLIKNGANDMYFLGAEGSTDPRDGYMVAFMKNDLVNFTNGNVVIGIYYKNFLLWSWHVWITDFEANGKTYVDSDGRTYMDRNLGGGVKYQADGTTVLYDPVWYGMFYQWGRKDPFPPAKEESLGGGVNGVTGTVPIFDHEGNRTYIVHNNVPEINNLPNAVRNPHVFYTNLNAMSDWVTSTNELRHQRNHMWSDRFGMKGMFDPCPYGWRVPAYARGEAVDNPWPYASPWSFDKGWQLPMGYFPGSGYKYRGNGDIWGWAPSWNGHYWFANETIYTSDAWGWGWQVVPSHSTYGVPNVAEGSRAQGGTIRCMKDDQDLTPHN